ncbi:MAG: hypothetical protein WCE80_04430, partial [Acidimicrobiia bacterium]
LRGRAGEPAMACTADRVQPRSRRGEIVTVQLFVFDSSRPVLEAVAGPDAVHRADAIVVDWERSGKEERQSHAAALLGFDTQIAPDSPVDLDAVVAYSTVPVICRVDSWAHSGRSDLSRAIDSGVSEVIVPMVRGPSEVEQSLSAADGRAGVGVMIETVAAVAAAGEIASLPIARAYLGLMDLALERRTPDIFSALTDGTLDQVAEELGGIPFGFAGLTVPGRGFPVPTRTLATEMLRVGASFTFLRRSFLADAGSDLAGGLRDIRGMLVDLTSPVTVSEPMPAVR